MAFAFTQSEMCMAALTFLAQLLACIDAETAPRPAPRVLEVVLGDYIDRGPDSRAVLDLLVSRSGSHEIVCLKGNHETFIHDFLRDPTVLLGRWKSFGGFETLMSYGVVPPTGGADLQDQREIAEAFNRALPDSHRRFLAKRRRSAWHSIVTTGRKGPVVDT
jgi:serine/threonine protein phosphatase 1